MIPVSSGVVRRFIS